MKKTWELESYENIPMRVPTEEYKQLLDEVAELVYSYIRQLQDKTKASEFLMDQPIKRTGTDE